MLIFFFFRDQVQIVLIDNKCQELWSLLKSAQNSRNITTQDIIRYRREAERHVGPDDQLYRLQWVDIPFSYALIVLCLTLIDEGAKMRAHLALQRG